MEEENIGFFILVTILTFSTAIFIAFTFDLKQEKNCIYGAMQQGEISNEIVRWCYKYF